MCGQCKTISRDVTSSLCQGHHQLLQSGDEVTFAYVNVHVSLTRQVKRRLHHAHVDHKPQFDRVPAAELVALIGVYTDNHTIGAMAHQTNLLLRERNDKTQSRDQRHRLVTRLDHCTECDNRLYFRYNDKINDDASICRLRRRSDCPCRRRCTVSLRCRRCVAPNCSRCRSRGRSRNLCTCINTANFNPPQNYDIR